MPNRLTSAFAVAVLGVVAILIVPLPPAVLDVLLALNVFGSSLILLVSLRVEEPLEFSAFAPTLLLATLFRLALDVSATRLILTQGHEPGGVGALIPAFGQFVVRGNVVVGLIVFAILIIIQFVVIASGAQRGYYTTVSERPVRSPRCVSRAYKNRADDMPQRRADRNVYPATQGEPLGWPSLRLYVRSGGRVL